MRRRLDTFILYHQKIIDYLEKKSDGWSKVSAKYAPQSQVTPELGTESYFQIYADH